HHYFEVRSDKAISEVAVIDFSGRQLMAVDGGGAKHVTVSVSHLTAGVYMVAVKGNDFYWLRKLIIY
ncbi:MAG TPA: T9SS type A sorting domain-containing protein, partial [Paludibacteraceae bacterium]|nr:T9SS type A sorting domain-containing protein [Paludibacteraceae bacterium]